MSQDREPEACILVEDAAVAFLKAIRALPKNERPTQLILMARRRGGPDDDKWFHFVGCGKEEQ